jgi:hypothetical protein
MLYKFNATSMSSTAMSWGAYFDCQGTMEKVLAQGGDVNTLTLLEDGIKLVAPLSGRESEGATPLIHSIITSNVPIATWLLDHKAEIHKPAKVLWLYGFGDGEWNGAVQTQWWKPLYWAIRHSHEHTIRKGTWSKDEDAKLLDAVDKYGFRWSRVAKAVGSRNGDQVFKRWGDCLDPRIDKSPWTAVEVSKQTTPVSTGHPLFFRRTLLTTTPQDERLLQQVALTGRNWSEMVTKHFPNRTSLPAKNRHAPCCGSKESSGSHP